MFYVRTMLSSGQVFLSRTFPNYDDARRWADLCRGHIPDAEETTILHRRPAAGPRYRSLADAMKNAPEMFDEDGSPDPAA